MVKKQFRPFFIRWGLAFLLLFIILVVSATAKEFYVIPPAAQAAPQGLPTLSFTNSGQFSITEGGAAVISVQISAVPTNTVTVQFTFTPVTGSGATTGDYTPPGNTTLTFTSSSSTTQTFQVTAVDDALPETPEYVIITLQNPVNAAIGATGTATLTINDNDPTPTRTQTPGGTSTPVFVDIYEPNNTLSQAYTTASDANPLCTITLWPRGDEDFFRFSGKAGSTYEVITTNLSPGLDTVLTVYNTQLNEIATNDDVNENTLASGLYFTANADGFYYARVVNQDPSDPANKTYCIEVNEIDAPTMTPSWTPIPGDSCEFNSTFDYACEIGVGTTYSFNFVPTLGSERDTDSFKLYVKPGILYTCETLNLSPIADTNMIFYDNNGQPFNPWLGNDDKPQTGSTPDFGSKLSYLSTYTGYLYIQIGPRITPPYEEASLHTYDLRCDSSISTPTPTATSTIAVAPTSSGGGGGGIPAAPTATPIIFPTFPPTPTPIDFATLFASSPTPTPPSIQFQPLPTATPFSGGQQIGEINLTLYYDTNYNFTPELTEGIMDVAVALYDNGTGQLIAFGYTNEVGVFHFDSVTSTGAVRVVVPFLNYNQVVFGGSSNILLRVAPQPLPIGIP